MTKTLLIGGYGPGISHALAERFGEAGFQIALVARSQARLDAGVAALRSRDVRAAAFTADLSDPKAAGAVVDRVRTELGPLDALAWAAYSGGAGDLLTADPAELRSSLDIATTGLVGTVQAALPDLRERQGAVLVTNGGLGLFDDEIDAMGAQGAMGLSIANSAKHKLVRLLAQKLRPDVFVGEVMVLGLVKGTAFDQGGHATIEPSTVAAKFWELYEARAQNHAQVG